MEASAEKIWNNCLIFIKDNIQQQAYKTWFEPIIPLKLTENSLSIQVPSKFFYEWLEEHYVKILKVALTRELGKDARLIYTIKMENTFGNKAPFTESIPSSNQVGVNAQQVDAPLPTITLVLNATASGVENGFTTMTMRKENVSEFTKTREPPIAIIHYS